MIDKLDKKDCNGCRACTTVCPVKCIDMIDDQEGFWYPHIDESRCIHCNLCEKKCPVMNEHHKESMSMKKAYAAYNKDESVRMESSSGGVFTLLASEVLKNGGVVFGAKYNEDLEVIHDWCETLEGVAAFRGSKYVQSNIGANFAVAEAFLKEGREVLFSGTPCQIGGLYSYLSREYEHLFVTDIVCHGVPSPRVYRDYKRAMEKKSRSKLSGVTFRDKSNGWRHYKVRVDLKQGSPIIETFTANAYMKAFLKDLSLRPSCYNCAFKEIDRQSDITLADFWGIENVKPELDDDKGTSLLLVHSQKGLDKIKGLETIMEEVDFMESIQYNPSMYQSVKKPDKREIFIQTVNGKNFHRVVNGYTKEPITIRLKSLMMRILSKIKRLILRILRK